MGDSSWDRKNVDSGEDGGADGRYELAKRREGKMKENKNDGGADRE